MLYVVVDLPKATPGEVGVIDIVGVIVGVIVLVGVIDIVGVIDGVILIVGVIDIVGVTDGIVEQSVTLPIIPEGPTNTAHLLDPPNWNKYIP